MKKMEILCGLLVVMLCFTTASAQFKPSLDPRPSVAESILRTDDGSFLSGLFDPSKFNMQHSFSLSYMSMAGQGMSLGTYTNSMRYQFADNLDIRTDISLMASPYNSFGKDAQNSLSGLFLNRAELNYRPWKNTLLQISYRQIPAASWLGGGYGLGYGYGGYSPFYGIDRTQEENH